MTEDELDAFLREERTCRVATVSPSGPHQSALWFVWDGAALWLYSIVRSQRWTDVVRNPRMSILVDAGVSYGELRGAEIQGSAEVVGEAPRIGEDVGELEEPERLFAAKYSGTPTLQYDQRHAWLRIQPDKISSWDFRKMPTG
jgi:hypothetical protein